MTDRLAPIRDALRVIPGAERDYTSDALLILADMLADAAEEFCATEAAAMGGRRMALALRALEDQARALARVFAPPAEEPPA